MIFEALWLLNAFCIGMVAGKWITDKRWARNAKEIQRHHYSGGLYKVFDVTPWKKKDEDEQVHQDRQQEIERIEHHAGS